jgi:MoaA/NifB/PqqE/SkfB family radical SAM enzyme
MEIDYSKGWTQIELTDFCNLSCIMCEQGGKVSWNKNSAFVHQRRKNFLDFNLWKKIITDFKELGKFWEISPFWLGEPTLHPQFDSFINFLSENGNFHSFQIHTNLNILTPSIK